MIEGFGKILSLQRRDNLVGQIFVLLLGFIESLLQSGRDLLDRQGDWGSGGAPITTHAEKRCEKHRERELDKPEMRHGGEVLEILSL